MLIIYGAGVRGKQLREYLDRCGIFADAFVDRIGDGISEIEGLVVYPLTYISKYQFATYLISPENAWASIYDYLLSCGVQAKNILSYEQAIVEFFPSDKVENHIAETKKIIFAYPTLYFGGVEAWIKSVCCELLDQHFNVRALTLEGEYPLPGVLKNNVMYVVHEPDFFDQMRQYVETTMRNLPCVFISMGRLPDFLAACIIKKRFPNQIVNILTVHMGRSIVYEQDALFSNFIDSYIGVSEDIQHGLINQGVPGHKVLHMTCPVAVSTNLARSYTLDGQQPLRIGWAGRIEKNQKRLDRLPELLLELISRNIPFHIYLAGEGIFLSELEKNIKEKGIQNTVTFLGKIDRKKIPTFWQTMDIGINLSEYEGRSISTMEIMANGAVPVVTDVSGVKEDIINGANGFYVANNSDFISEMANVIQKLDENRSCLPEMGRKAWETIYSKATMKQHLDFWNSVLAEYA